MPFKHTFGAWFWARPFVTTLSHSKTPLRLLYKRTLLTLPWAPRNGSPSILCCDWLRLFKQIILVYSSLIQFLGCGPAISWVCCPKKSQLSSSCNKQISKSAYYSLCSREQCLLSGICRFLGLVFCDFLAISLRMPFKNKCAIWGLILGMCFCRSPFLWRAIDFSFFWAGSGIFFGFLNFFCSCFSAFLLLCFSACLLFCSLLVCFSCFSAILFFPCFSASLLFYFYLSFSAVMHFHDISNKDKNTQTIPIFRVTFSRIWIVQASVISRFPIWPIPTYMGICLSQVWF